MTAFIPMLDYDKATPEQRETWDAEIAKRGRITNMKKTFLHSVPAFHAYMEFYVLYERLLPVFGKRAVWLFCHAISSGNDCLICTMYFRRNLLDAGVDPATYEPDENEQLFIDFGRSFSHANGGKKPSAELWGKLKEKLSNEQLVDLVGLGGLMVATNMFNDYIDIPLDDSLYEYMPKTEG